MDVKKLTNELLNKLNIKLKEQSKQEKLLKDLTTEIAQISTKIDAQINKIIADEYCFYTYDFKDNSLSLKSGRSQDIPKNSKLIKIQEFLGATDYQVLNKLSRLKVEFYFD